MERWPSGVTMTRHLAVGEPSMAGGVVKAMPRDSRSRWKAAPNSSLRTLPMYDPVPPREARAAIVFPTDPPDISTALLIACCMTATRSASTSVMAPLGRPWAARKASSAWARTSTIALPMPTTSLRLLSLFMVSILSGFLYDRLNR